METLTNSAKKARAEYMRKYRQRETDEQKEKRREYARKWRQDNPDKIKAARVRYWNKKAEAVRAAASN